MPFWLKFDIVRYNPPPPIWVMPSQLGRGGVSLRCRFNCVEGLCCHCGAVLTRIVSRGCRAMLCRHHAMSLRCRGIWVHLARVPCAVALRWPLAICPTHPIPLICSYIPYVSCTWFRSFSIYIYIYIYVCTCMYMYMYIYIYICVYIYLCVYIYIYINIYI